MIFPARWPSCWTCGGSGAVPIVLCDCGLDGQDCPGPGADGAVYDDPAAADGGGDPRPFTIRRPVWPNAARWRAPYKSLIFQNEDNGYTVLSLLTEDGELVTVVVHPLRRPGEGMTVTGVWTNHPSYGPSSRRRNPWSGACPGRGGDRILPVLRHSQGHRPRHGPAAGGALRRTPGRYREEAGAAATVKGITAKKAMELSAAFRELTGLKRDGVSGPV